MAVSNSSTKDWFGTGVGSAKYASFTQEVKMAEMTDAVAGTHSVIVKDLYKEDLIDKERLVVDFQGGEMSVLKESEELIEELLKNFV